MTPNGVINKKMRWQSRKLRKTCARCFKYWTSPHPGGYQGMCRDYNVIKSKEEAGNGFISMPGSSNDGREDVVLPPAVPPGLPSGGSSLVDSSLQEQIEALTERITELEDTIEQWSPVAMARLQADNNGRVQQLEQGYHGLFSQITELRNNQNHGHPDLYIRIQELQEAVQLVSAQVHEAVQCMEAMGVTPSSTRPWQSFSKKWNEWYKK